MAADKYSSIRSLAQLDRALSDLRTEQQLTRTKLASDYKFFKAFYTPANFYNFVLDKISPAFNLVGLGIDLYDRLVERIARHRAERRARQQAEQQEQPVPVPDQTPSAPSAEA